jgi:hypothetical protein
VSILLCKLALAPAFVVLVSMIARRFGPRIGGVIGGLPVVAGPILLVLALQEGDAFAADAARASVLSLSGLTAFVVLCARTPEGVPALAAVIVGWAVFLGIGGAVAAADLTVPAALAVSVAVFAVALRWALPAAAPHAPTASRPSHDLALRAAAAAAMVLAVTSASDALGPSWSGVLAPFPTVTSVLAGFSLAHDPRSATQALLRSMVIGFFSFAAFLATVAVALEPWGTAPAFLAAVAVAAVMQAAFLVALSRAPTAALATASD